MANSRPLSFVLFGATGDLAMRKLLPALYHLHLDDLLPEPVQIFAVARGALADNSYRALARLRCESFIGNGFNAAVWEKFASYLHYLEVDLAQEKSYARLASALEAEIDHDRVFYLSTGPDLFTVICRNLHAIGLVAPSCRVVLEKPLGNDLESSRAINDEVGRYFAENQIYRIDHYLGKEPVQNLLALRFGNIFFEPLWQRQYVRDVQITVAEQVGVESRGAFYEKTGAMRDMVQNHLLQLLCIVAMEPPASIEPGAVRDEKLKVLRALRTMTEHDVAVKTVRGQYRAGAIAGQPVPGYLEEADVAPESLSETFVALKLEIDTWRWAGVPFFLRTGKRMQEKLAEIVINFHAVPYSIFGGSASKLQSNRLVIRMQPEESVQMHLLAKQPGDVMHLHPVHLDLDLSETFRTRRLEAYERLLMDVMRGNLTLFVRRDEQEAAWRWVEPILDVWQATGDKPKPYLAGTWGPAASTTLPSRDGLTWFEEI